MPFIWDDNEYQFIDDEDEYDKHRFVIVRKLFISLKNEDSQENHQFNEALIERCFRKFGEIESIEILASENREAYITFVSDRCAYLAVAHNSCQSGRLRKQFKIQPADTWTQPKQESDNIDDSIEDLEECDVAFFTLNEDCILEIFKHLDFESLINVSEVCKLFNRLLHQHIFPHFTSFAIENSTKDIQMPLAKVRRSLICIGPYITELKFRWHDYDHNNRLQRFLEKLGQYVGKNIRRIRFWDVLLYEEHIPAIKSIFSIVDTLEITVYNPAYDLDLDFQELCPNLRKLKLLENMQLIRCCKPWPKLEYLSNVGNEYMVLNTFRSFLAQNPQLRCLKFTAYHADERLQAVAQLIPGVQKLTILPSFPNLTASNIVYLSSLEHLTKLNLMYLDEADLNGILQCLIRFKSLRVLKLHLLYDGGEEDLHYEPNQQNLIAIAQELPNLEMFCTRYIKWKESTVKDFLKFTSRLKALHIHWSDLKITNSMIWEIFKVLQANRQPLNGIIPLELFVNATDITGIQTIRDHDILRFLNLNTKCSHIGNSAESIF
ncbi:uncharacterized protein LOC116341063 [Contarinia nasturtii]|uniref:uncharacterized protein LOC116341063 n=1 Tax=Contarinia nasturtii TaxID=265458 RepID=UPI0012D3E06E|nr:uncharacterized protein LOC116341063 [Contarinia nasturtii]